MQNKYTETQTHTEKVQEKAKIDIFRTKEESIMAHFVYYNSFMLTKVCSSMAFVYRH